MSSLIVKSSSGLIWGSIGSLLSIYIANLFYTKPNKSFKELLKEKLYLPICFGGITGFTFGYTTTPLFSLYNYTYKTK